MNTDRMTAHLEKLDQAIHLLLEKTVASWLIVLYSAIDVMASRWIMRIQRLAIVSPTRIG